MLEPELKHDEIVSILAEVVVFDDHQTKHCLKTALKGLFLRFHGSLPAESTVVLIVGAKTLINQGQPTLHAVDDTRVFHRPYVGLSDIRRVVEVCSGAGFLGMGLEHSGFEVTLRCDHNTRMLQLASQLHPAEVVLGDVCTDSLLTPICSSQQRAGTLAGGVACQPYSRLGDQRHGLDNRSMTLPGVLRIGFMCRFGAIVLECVAEAHSCPWFQMIIRQFAQLTGYGIAQGVCHLNLLWPAKRSRWWCILTHPAIGQVQWIPMPITTAMPIVADLLDRFKDCTDEELQQLALDLYETGRFAAHGFENNELQWRNQMQTSLHSCGSQLSGCPCGCRKFAFHDDRLTKKGLHGILIRLAGSQTCGMNTYPCFRHIHPAELALLNGMVPDMPWGRDLKMSLCALGQLASPIQSTWVGSMLMRHIQISSESNEVIDPHVNLLQWMEKVLNSRDAVFGPQTNPNAKHFEQLVHTRVFATTMPPSDKPAEVNPLTKQIPNANAFHATEAMQDQAGDKAEQPDSANKLCSPDVSGMSSSAESMTSVKRPASTMYHEASTANMPAQTNGGVYGFQNTQVKKSRKTEVEVPGVF